MRTVRKINSSKSIYMTAYYQTERCVKSASGSITISLSDEWRIKSELGSWLHVVYHWL